MRFSLPLLTVAGTVAGTAAAVVAYQATAAVGPATRPASVSTQEPVPAAATSWLPCERGWKVEGTTCVRIERKVVVVHDLPAQAAAPARTVGVRAPASVPTTHATENENETQHVEQGDQNEAEHADGTSEDTQQASEPGDDGPDHEDVGND